MYSNQLHQLRPSQPLSPSNRSPWQIGNPEGVDQVCSIRRATSVIGVRVIREYVYSQPAACDKRTAAGPKRASAFKLQYMTGVGRIRFVLRVDVDTREHRGVTNLTTNTVPCPGASVLTISLCFCCPLLLIGMAIVSYVLRDGSIHIWAGFGGFFLLITLPHALAPGQLGAQRLRVVGRAIPRRFIFERSVLTGTSSTEAAPPTPEIFHPVCSSTFVI